MFGLGLSCGLKQRKLAAAMGAFTDDFESYTAAGADLFAQSNWAHARTAASFTVETGNYINGTNASDGLDGAYESSVGNGYTNGTVSAEVSISTGGHANSQPGLLARWVTVDNFVWASLNNGFNQLNVASYIDGVSTQTNVAASWTRGQTYYMDLILNGSSCTANVYTDAEKTILYKTATHTNCYTGSGYMGLVVNAQATGRGNFDNWSFTPA